jgi:hypothetical protein
MLWRAQGLPQAGDRGKCAARGAAGPGRSRNGGHPINATCIDQAERTAMTSSNALIAAVRTGDRVALNQPAS